MYQVPSWKELTRLNKSNLKRQGIYSGLPENWQEHEDCKDSKGRYNHFKACKYVKDANKTYQEEILESVQEAIDANEAWKKDKKKREKRLQKNLEKLKMHEKIIKDYENFNHKRGMENIIIDVVAVEVVDDDKELLSIGPSTMRKINF